MPTFKNQIESAVDRLNRWLEIDSDAIREILLEGKARVNRTFADDPDFQVLSDPDELGRYTARGLGLINGLFGTNEKGLGYIIAELDDNDNIEKFWTRWDWESQGL